MPVALGAMVSWVAFARQPLKLFGLSKLPPITLRYLDFCGKRKITKATSRNHIVHNIKISIRKMVTVFSICKVHNQFKLKSFQT